MDLFELKPNSNDRAIGNAQLWRVKKIYLSIAKKPIALNYFSKSSTQCVILILFLLSHIKMVWIDSTPPPSINTLS